MYEVALIGTGYWGKRLSRYIEENPNLSLKYTCNSKSDLNEVWKDRDVQVVVVATPIDTHYDVVKQALLAGKHILSEKPLAMRVEEVLQLKALSEKNELLLLTEFTYTFSESLQYIRSMLIPDCLFGKLKAVDFSLKYIGRFIKFDVYWLLASHLLSVLDIFTPIKGLIFDGYDLIVHEGKVETGLIYFNGRVNGQLSVSLNYPEREARFIFYGETGTIVYNALTNPSVKFAWYERVEGALHNELVKRSYSCHWDESNNLRHAVKYLVKALNGEAPSNIDRSVEVTRILENLTYES